MRKLKKARKVKQVNRQFKANVFADLFEDPMVRLEVYNALNGTSYTDVTLIEDTTLDDVIYLGRKNDVSFLVGCALNLYEHQSTPNLNMAIRMLIYYVMIMEIRLKGKNVYGNKLIEIPVPRFVVFYNGEMPMPERSTITLSQAFMREKDINGMPIGDLPHGDIEVTVTVLNINKGFNEELLSKCPTLEGYCYLINSIRDYKKAGKPTSDAISKAIQDCIKNDKIADYLNKKGSDAMGWLLTEYDEEKMKQAMYEDGREDGKAEGREEGKAEGLAKGEIKAMYKYFGVKPVDIAEKMNISLSEVESVIKELGL